MPLFGCMLTGCPLTIPAIATRQTLSQRVVAKGGLLNRSPFVESGDEAVGVVAPVGAGREYPTIDCRASSGFVQTRGVP